MFGWVAPVWMRLDGCVRGTGRQRLGHWLPPRWSPRRPGRRAVLCSVGAMPAPKIGRPKTSVKKSTPIFNEPSPTPETESDAGLTRPKMKRKTDTEFVPMWKVILIGDEEYEERYVVQVLVKNIPKLDKNEARRIYHEAQTQGEALIIVVAQEHAEFFATMLKRSELYVRIEPE